MSARSRPGGDIGHTTTEVAATEPQHRSPIARTIRLFAVPIILAWIALMGMSRTTPA